MFGPHHSFKNCTKLERYVVDLHKKSRVPEELFQSYLTYHFGLLHKLRSAQHYLQNLEDVLQNTTIEDDTAAITELVFRVNMPIDGFFYCGGSALDILAREVLTYFGIALPDSVYYRTAYENIQKVNPSDPLLPRLDNPSWKEEFSNYRNAATHEVLLTGKFSIEIEPEGGTHQSRIVYPLADDPREDRAKRKYTKNPDALRYCQTTFKRVLRHINAIYGEIHTRAVTGGTLPL